MRLQMIAHFSHPTFFSYKTFNILFTSHKLQLLKYTRTFFSLSCNLMLHQKKYFLSSLYNLFDFYHALVCAKIRKSCFSSRDFLFYPLDLIHNTPREKRIAAKKNRRKFPFFSFFSPHW